MTTMTRTLILAPPVEDMLAAQNERQEREIEQAARLIYELGRLERLSYEWIYPLELWQPTRADYLAYINGLNTSQDEGQ
jgi:hypothetical protein